MHNILVLLASTLWLVACGGDPRQAELADYSDRLARVVEQDAGTEPQVSPLNYPERRSLQDPDLGDDSINLLDFLNLGECQLQQSLARRNSSLGKLGSTSQDLLYQLEFLQHAPACIRLLEDQQQDKLAQQLAAVMANKQAQLARHMWQAILGAKEFGLFWQAPQALNDYPAQTGSDLTNALENLQRMSRRWLDGDLSANSSELEDALSTIRSGDGGSLFRALALQDAWLSQANTQLQLRRKERPLCYPGRDNTQGKILFNVMQKFWLQQLQPWSAQLNQRAYELLPAVRALEETLANGEPASYTNWREQRDRQFDHLLLAPRRHVGAIRPLLEQCGLAPGQDTSNDTSAG